MTGRWFTLQVSGRLVASDLIGVDQVTGRVRLSTVLRTSLRDQSALQGLLRRIHAVGLALIAVHEVDVQQDDRPGADAHGEHVFEVTVDGPIGEVVSDMLGEYVGPIEMATRYSFTDAVVMGDVLARLLERGAALEHVLETDRDPG